MMSSSSTQTGNPETRRSVRSLLVTPVTVDAGTQVSSVSEGYASPSVSVERLDGPTITPAISRMPPVVGCLRESFIGLRETGKEEAVKSSVPKQTYTVEHRPSRSASRDRSDT